MFSTDDTIVAIATPPGHAGIGVVRIAGPLALTIGTALLARDDLQPRYATFGRFRANDASGNETLDQVVATYFPAPNSYTGDPVLEISAHGSPVLLERIVESAIAAGARLARPGEFTLRAYLNGKLDLVQAEAVADLVDAVTPAQVRVAYDQLDGSLSRALASIAGALFDIRVRLEASLDFPDEGYHFGAPEVLRAELDAIVERVQTLIAASRRGRAVREGRTVVILGPTNAGKSSLFNRLLRSERAIVAAEEGTTRDLLSERLELQGLPVTLVDTAGFREGGGSIEQEGMARAEGVSLNAALRIVVLDLGRPLEPQQGILDRVPAPRVVVANKADRPPSWPLTSLAIADPVIPASAATGEGMENVSAAVRHHLLADSLPADTPAVANMRQVVLIETLADVLTEARRSVADGNPEEVVLSHLSQGDRLLDEIVGRRTPDDVLAAIFSRFCIGK